MARQKDRPDLRSGEVLGLGGADAGMQNRESASGVSPASESDAARRHRRMSEGADELLPETSGPGTGGSGATGIDMGAGGEGTDIE